MSCLSGESISVLIPVGPGLPPDDVVGAINSVRYQTLPPEEILVVTNTPLDDVLEQALRRLSQNLPVVTRLHDLTRPGLGGALQYGLETATTDFVARMDADDIAVSTRFERQRSAMEERNVDVLGGQMVEFEGGPQNPRSVRSVPTTHADIAASIDSRCPFNHPTVMLRRERVLDAGGYRNYESMEDWELWIRCLEQGLRLENLDDVLVYARAGDGLYVRRGGYTYAKGEVNMQRRLYRDGVISLGRAIRNTCLRTPVRLLPPTVRKYLYRQFARSKFDDR